MLSSLLLTVPLIQSLVRQVPTLMLCGPAQAQPYGQRLGIQLLGVTLGEASEAATLTTNQSRSWEHETGQAAVPPPAPIRVVSIASAGSKRQSTYERRYITATTLSAPLRFVD